MNKSLSLRVVTVITVILAVPVARDWAASVETNSAPRDILEVDSLGRVVQVPTNAVPARLNPPADIGVKKQIPQPTRGSLMSDEVRLRLHEAQDGFQFFPAVPPELMSYLASQDEFGNTAARPGPLFSFDPFEPYVQGAKYRLSEYGLRYSLIQTVTYVNMTDVTKGDNTLGYYTLDFKAKWAIYTAPAEGTAGWISAQVDAKNGIDAAGDNQNPKSNVGTIASPTSIWSGVNGVRVPELAWQQSLVSGHVVVVAGMVNQKNYLDRNAYAQSGRNGYLNSALSHSLVLPMGSYKFGFNLQWQPEDEWYAMLGGNMGQASAGDSPWTDLNSRNWSLISELGYAPRDLLGLGPGIYRAQPFVAQAGESTGGGLCFDLQQKLGPHSPFGWFGRFGFGDSDVANSAAAGAATGFVMQGPFRHVLLQRTSNDLLGVGFVWSQPAATTKTVYHENEYILETLYAMQLTPTIKLQPDLQVVRDPAFNNKSDHALVFQLQLVMAW